MGLMDECDCNGGGNATSKGSKKVKDEDDAHGEKYHICITSKQLDEGYPDLYLIFNY